MSIEKDIVIVGGGISGLLAAYRISQRDSERKVVILEASDRLGGRLFFNDFHGVDVPLGGSIIRHTDERVLSLARELDLEIGGFVSDLKAPYFSWMNKFIGGLKEKIKMVEITPTETVYEYLTRNYIPNEVDWFINNSIYRDFIDGNMRQFVRNYPLDDLIQPEGKGMEMYYIQGGYGKMVNGIVDLLRKTPSVEIRLDTEVTNIEHTGQGVSIQTTRGGFIARYVVWATGHQSYVSLPKSLQNNLSHVIGIPFIRVYGYSEIDQADFPETVTSGIIGKVFPKSSNVFQIAYTEGDWAVRLAAMLVGKSRTEQVNLMKQLLLRGLGREILLDDLVYQYWSSGIHQYMSDKDGIVHEGNINVIGEAVSTNQGWVEGCLETVESLMKKYLNLNE